MSIVGPRPEREEFVTIIEERLPEFKERKRVNPGITGLAAIKLGYYATPEEKIVYDLEYINNWSILKDIKICIMTIIKLLKTIDKDIKKQI